MSNKDIINEALIQEIVAEVESEQGVSGIAGDTMYFDFILEVAKKINQKKQEVLPDFKLFIWTGVLGNYSDGVMFALAHTVEEAQQVIRRDRMDWIDVHEIYEKPPEIVEDPKGFLFAGGE